MVRSLNKFILSFWFLVSGFGFAQTGHDANSVYRPKDYKDQEAFKNYGKRRKAVAKWQINQLKNGALVVRLHSNQTLVESLKKMGKADLATQKEQESFAINKNIVKAFQRCYNFSKVYFFFGEHTDTLLNGTRSGIFLDSNLSVDPNIVMNEKFFMMLEKDDIYNSSIGFFPEDTAKFIKERGNITDHTDYLVMKNKYGHQVKAPFPVSASSFVEDAGSPVVYRYIGDKVIQITIPKAYRINRMCRFASDLSRRLRSFYEANKGFEVKDPTVKPFLY
jgi:hypothetical protein